MQTFLLACLKLDIFLLICYQVFVFKEVTQQGQEWVGFSGQFLNANTGLVWSEMSAILSGL